MLNNERCWRMAVLGLACGTVFAAGVLASGSVSADAAPAQTSEESVVAEQTQEQVAEEKKDYPDGYRIEEGSDGIRCFYWKNGKKNETKQIRSSYMLVDEDETPDGITLGTADREIKKSTAVLYYFDEDGKGTPVVGYVAVKDGKVVSQQKSKAVIYEAGEAGGLTSVSPKGALYTVQYAGSEDMDLYIKDRRIHTGWVSKKGEEKRYYKKGLALNGRNRIDGSYYFFDEEGRVQTGWADGGYYTTAKKNHGKQQFGLKKIDGEYYYLDESDEGNAATGWKKLDGKKYYFSKKKKSLGQAYKGRHKIKKHFYYFDTKKAVMKKGWVKIKKKKFYYQKKNGRQVFGMKKIEGKRYIFKKKGGALIQQLVDSMDIRAQSCSSKTKYLILVNSGRHQVRVYKGSEENWKRVKTFVCATGKASTPTVRGQFTVGGKGIYFDTGVNGRCWYYTQFHGDYLFHSVIYVRASTPGRIAQSGLGSSVSHGCVRLSLSSAKWIYQNVPIGSKVLSY